MADLLFFGRDAIRNRGRAVFYFPRRHPSCFLFQSRCTESAVDRTFQPIAGEEEDTKRKGRRRRRGTTIKRRQRWKKDRQHFSRHSNQSQRLFVGEIVRTIGPPIATVDEKTDVFQRVEFSDRSRMDSFLPALILGEIHANRGEEV